MMLFRLAEMPIDLRCQESLSLGFALDCDCTDEVKAAESAGFRSRSRADGQYFFEKGLAGDGLQASATVIPFTVEKNGRFSLD